MQRKGTIQVDKVQGTLREMTTKRSAYEQPAGPSAERPKHK